MFGKGKDKPGKMLCNLHWEPFFLLSMSVRYFRKTLFLGQVFSRAKEIQYLPL